MAALEDLVEPERVLRDLEALHGLSSDARGAQRVAWTPVWSAARRWLVRRLEEAGAAPRLDAAGNLWSGAGTGRPVVMIGSHLDSVPDGGRYDGALGVLAGLEVLRAARGLAPLPCGIGLIDFADEEGARFGHSLFGSTALVGDLDVDAVAQLTDERGERLADVVAAHGVDVAAANGARAGLADVLAYVELHVEQGPELDRDGIPVAAVAGATGIERLQVRLVGQATHAGATSMTRRRDPMLAAAGAVAEIADAAAADGALATFGRWDVEPSIPTAVPARVELTVDLRHPEADALARLVEVAQATFAAHAERRGCQVSSSLLWRMPPVRFDAALVDAAREAAAWAGGTDATMLSGRGHDAVVVAGRVPVTMLFCPSRDGLSHNPDEHTEPEAIVRAVRALARLVGRVAAGEVVPAGRPEPSNQETA